jgi:hypothetical protein
MCFQEIAEELHIKLVVLHDQDGLGHPPFPSSRCRRKLDGWKESLTATNGRLAKPVPISCGKDPMAKPPLYSQQTAETLAVQALGFIAEDEARLTGFVASTGIAVQSIRTAAGEPDFLAGVLDHVLADENLLMAFADSAGVDPAGIAHARHALGKVWEGDLP